MRFEGRSVLATTVVCLLVTAIIATPPVDPATIHTVHMVQSCHLDMGFVDFSTNIINRFFYEHFPDYQDSSIPQATWRR